MDDVENPQEPTGETHSNEAEAIARLLRLAGPRPRVPADRESRLRSAAHEHWTTTLKRGRRLRWAVWSGVALAAASLLVVVSTLRGWRMLDLFPAPGSPVATVLRVEGFLGVPAGKAPEAGTELKSGTALATGAGDRVALQMHGSGTVRIDSGTSLRLISNAAIDLETGALYVDSGSSGSAGSSLEIRTRLGTVRDVGTQFQVRLDRDVLQVSVREGIARLEREGVSHDATAGVELSLQHDGALTSRAISSTGGSWDWILGLAPSLQLEGAVLGEYLEWVARETGLKLEYQDPSILEDAKSVVLHGSIEGLRPEESLAAVLPTCKMAYAIDGDTLEIRRASQEGEPQSPPAGGR
jgi:ferric-dicitrate binding protein FerR (iron transport regulator)